MKARELSQILEIIISAMSAEYWLWRPYIGKVVKDVVMIQRTYARTLQGMQKPTMSDLGKLE